MRRRTGTFLVESERGFSSVNYRKQEQHKEPVVVNAEPSTGITDEHRSPASSPSPAAAAR
jgi:hypothetical protein